jgi:membrane-associated phospholipid phosphatase
VWAAFGVQNFSSYYQRLSPNAVAAMPSLHAAYPFFFALIIRKIWGNKWFYLSLIYPVSIWVGIVYLGEHYVVDVLAGIVYAIGAFAAAPYVLRWTLRQVQRCKPYWLKLLRKAKK